MILDQFPIFPWQAPHNEDLRAKVVKDLTTMAVSEDDESGADMKIRRGKVIVDEIARYMQSQYKYIFRSQIFWAYDADTGVWKEVKDHDMHNAIADFIGPHVPMQANTAKLGDIRHRMEDRVKGQTVSENQFAERDGFLNFRNGMLDMKLKRLFQHHPGYYSFYQIPFDYNPAAKCETWLKFLRFACENDEGVIKILQRYIIYVLMSDIDIHKYLHLLGPGGSGKSKFGETVMLLVGEEKSAAIDISDEKDSFPLDMLAGKKFLFMDEWEVPHLTPQAEKMLKQLGSFGIIRMKKKFSDSQSVRNSAKLLVCSNNFPHVSDASNAIFRRLMPIYFGQIIPTALQDEFFAKTNGFRTELPGIINWALEEYDNVRHLGSEAFRLTDKMQRWINDIKSFSNHIMSWADDECEFDSQEVPEDAMHRTEAFELFKNYTAWCNKIELNSRNRLNMVTFGRKLSQSFYNRIGKKKDRLGRTEWIGIYLKNAQIGTF